MLAIKKQKNISRALLYVFSGFIVLLCIISGFLEIIKSRFDDFLESMYWKTVLILYVLANIA